MPNKNAKNALTAQDLADILKIAKNTVYELVKRGEINSYKVGRKLRFTADDVEQYINRSRPQMPREFQNLSRQVQQRSQVNEEGNFIICGQDVILDVLASYLNEQFTDGKTLRAYIGSYNGLSALYRGEVQAATAHLWDGDLGQYNRSYVRALLPGTPSLIIRLAQRTQGLYVAKGNPMKINSWEDFKRPELIIFNREKGAGSRVLLDEHLRLMGLVGKNIKGYESEGQSHHALASAVGRGEADVAVGHQKAAEQVEGIDFIALQKEEYDLIIKKDDLRLPKAQAAMEIIKSNKFKQEFETMNGYELSEMGKIVGET